MAAKLAALKLRKIELNNHSESLKSPEILARELASTFAVLQAIQVGEMCPDPIPDKTADHIPATDKQPMQTNAEEVATLYDFVNAIQVHSLLAKAKDQHALVKAPQ